MLQVNGHSSEERLGNTYWYVNNEKTLRQLLTRMCEKLGCQKCAVVARQTMPKSRYCCHKIKALLVGNNAFRYDIPIVGQLNNIYIPTYHTAS